MTKLQPRNPKDRQQMWRLPSLFSQAVFKCFQAGKTSSRIFYKVGPQHPPTTYKLVITQLLTAGGPLLGLCPYLSPLKTTTFQAERDALQSPFLQCLCNLFMFYQFLALDHNYLFYTVICSRHLKPLEWKTFWRVTLLKKKALGKHSCGKQLCDALVGLPWEMLL